MTTRELARTIAMPTIFCSSATTMAARCLRLSDVDAEHAMSRLMSGEPTFGDLWETTALDIERAHPGASGADARALAELLHRVDPWTPVCPNCGDFPIIAVGGKLYDPLAPGAQCNWCATGTVTLVPVLLRRVHWVTGALVEPQLTYDRRTDVGFAIPLDDDAIRAWAKHIDPALDRALRDAGLPLYALLAYYNLKLNRFSKWGPAEALELLARPAEFGLWQKEELDRRIAEAQRFVDTREVTNLPRKFLTDGNPRADFAETTLGGRTVLLEGLVRRTDAYDVYRGRTDGDMPALLVVQALVTDDADQLAREIANLRFLAAADVSGSETFKMMVPELAFDGALRLPDATSWPALAYRYRHGFDWTLDDVRSEYPEGVDPKGVVWMGNRLFEIMSWFHAVGLVHGAIFPAHLVIEPRDHSMQVVGWSAAVRPGQRVAAVSKKNEAYYPAEALDGRPATVHTDIAMAARTLIALAGGDPATGRLPATVPDSLAELLYHHARYGSTDVRGLRPDARFFHQAWGSAAKAAYGPRAYFPTHMPRNTAARS